MGVEHIHQAIPDDSQLIRAARNPLHRSDREAIAAFPRYLWLLKKEGRIDLRGGWAQSERPFAKILMSEVSAIWDADPTIVDRRMELEKHFTRVHYLLHCAFPEQGPQDQQSLIYQCVYGAGPLAPDLGLDEYLRYSSPDDVAKICDFMDSIDYVHLANCRDVKTGEKLKDPYGEHEGRVDLVKELQDFFRVVSDTGEGVLTVLTF